MSTLTSRGPLPLHIQLKYAVGQLGWSTLINVIGLQLLFFYVPPNDAGLPYFIPQTVFLVVLNAITLILASGRLFDAITDPLIASWSDRSENPKGRRIPFMARGIIPAALFCVLMFVPPVPGISGWNTAWVAVMQIGFFVSITVYVTPFFALLPEMGQTAEERLNLATWISVTYALGIVLASLIPVIAAPFAAGFGTVRSFQIALVILAVIAALCMYVPVWTIREKDWVIDQESTSVPLGKALRQTLSNLNFRYYVVADFVYFMGITIVQTGLLFYITVLLGLPESQTPLLLGITVILSFVFYPVVNVLAKRIGKKRLITFSFMMMSTIFILIFFLGRLPLSPELQGYGFAILYSLPLAFLGVLPNAVLGDIAQHDTLKTGEAKEGMYFAARTLLQKFGQTFGLLVFAMLTTLGKDPGDDLGIRLSGVFGFVLCLAAGLIFLRYQEQKLLNEIDSLAAPSVS